MGAIYKKLQPRRTGVPLPPNALCEADEGIAFRFTDEELRGGGPLWVAWGSRERAEETPYRSLSGSTDSNSGESSLQVADLGAILVFAPRLNQAGHARARKHFKDQRTKLAELSGAQLDLVWLCIQITTTQAAQNPNFPFPS